MSTLRENLEAARALISKGWTQGWYAKDGEGNEVSCHDDRAEGYCLRGACMAVVEPTIDGVDGHAELIFALNGALGDVYLTKFNDTGGRTQAEVLALIDRAIGAAP